MTENELNLVAVTFDGLGGKKVKDCDGIYWLFHSGSFLLEVEPFLRKTNDGFTLGIDVSTSNPELSQIINRISGKRSNKRQQIKWRQWHQTIRSTNDLEATYRELLQNALSETDAVDFKHLVARLADELPSEKSLSQLSHLAALAYLGKARSLSEYREGLEAGRRYGFVPMINVAFLDRAIEEAEKRESQLS